MEFKNKVREIVDENKFSKLCKYVEMLEIKNNVMNLTGFKGNLIWKEGIYESIMSLRGNIESNEIMADIGAGAGFPSIPFLISTNKNIKLIIFEPIKKRALFLEEVIKELNLNAFIIKSRIEDYNENNGNVDFITARAVTSLENLIEITCQLGKVGSKYFFIKGKKLNEELIKASGIIRKLNINYKIKKLNLFTDKEINIFEYIKSDECPSKFPRPWKEIKNKRIN